MASDGYSHKKMNPMKENDTLVMSKSVEATVIGEHRTIMLPVGTVVTVGRMRQVMVRGLKTMYMCWLLSGLVTLGNQLRMNRPESLQTRAEKAAEMLARLKAAAAEQGYVCHNSEWPGSHAKCALICAAGHHFERRAADVLYKRLGCGECARESLRNRFRESVAERGGECLDGDYLGLNVQHRMRCQDGHEWIATGKL